MSYTIDLQKIADELDFDLEDIEMLIEVFLESAKESMQELKDSIYSNDFKRIFHSAHAIKGSAANLTLKDISDIAKFIEENAREAKDIDYNKYCEQLALLIDNIEKKIF